MAMTMVQQCKAWFEASLDDKIIELVCSYAQEHRYDLDSQAALNLEPSAQRQELIDALFWLGAAHNRQGIKHHDIPRIKAGIELLLPLYPEYCDDLNYFVSLALAFEFLGQYERSLYYLYEAMGQFPQVARVDDMIIDVAHKLNINQCDFSFNRRARDAWQELLANVPTINNYLSIINPSLGEQQLLQDLVSKPFTKLCSFFDVHIQTKAQEVYFYLTCYGNETLFIALEQCLALKRTGFPRNWHFKVGLPALGAVSLNVDELLFDSEHTWCALETVPASVHYQPSQLANQALSLLDSQLASLHSQAKPWLTHPSANPQLDSAQARASALQGHDTAPSTAASTTSDNASHARSQSSRSYELKLSPATAVPATAGSASSAGGVGSAGAQGTNDYSATASTLATTETIATAGSAAGEQAVCQAQSSVATSEVTIRLDALFTAQPEDEAHDPSLAANDSQSQDVATTEANAHNNSANSLTQPQAKPKAQNALYTEQQAHSTLSSTIDGLENATAAAHDAAQRPAHISQQDWEALKDANLSNNLGLKTTKYGKGATELSTTVGAEQNAASQTAQGQSEAQKSAADTTTATSSADMAFDLSALDPTLFPDLFDDEELASDHAQDSQQPSVGSTTDPCAASDHGHEILLNSLPTEPSDYQVYELKIYHPLLFTWFKASKSQHPQVMERMLNTMVSYSLGELTKLSRFAKLTMVRQKPNLSFKLSKLNQVLEAMEASGASSYHEYLASSYCLDLPVLNSLRSSSTARTSTSTSAKTSATASMSATASSCSEAYISTTNGPISGDAPCHHAQCAHSKAAMRSTCPPVSNEPDLLSMIKLPLRDEVLFSVHSNATLYQELYYSPCDHQSINLLCAQCVPCYFVFERQQLLKSLAQLPSPRAAQLAQALAAAAAPAAAPAMKSVESATAIAPSAVGADRADGVDVSLSEPPQAAPAHDLSTNQDDSVLKGDGRDSAKLEAQDTGVSEVQIAEPEQSLAEGAQIAYGAGGDTESLDKHELSVAQIELSALGCEVLIESFLAMVKEQGYQYSLHLLGYALNKDYIFLDVIAFDMKLCLHALSSYLTDNHPSIDKLQVALMVKGSEAMTISFIKGA